MSAAYFQPGRVVAIEESGPGWQIALVELLAAPGETVRAFCETELLGPLAPGDNVILNETARRLNLGTGGFDFVYWVCDRPPPDPAIPGHLIKLRYTPQQRMVLSVEEPASPWRQAYLQQERSGLEGRPVVAIGLHSQLAGVVAGIRSVATADIGFVQLEGGALPAKFSRLVRGLKSDGHIKTVITAGHAYGGDLEAISPASGLLAAAMAGAQVLIAGPGPGIAGTASTYGTSALQKAELLNIVSSLGGIPIACLRLSRADTRARHRPISHHSITVLKMVNRPVWVPVPANLPEIQRRLESAGVGLAHSLVQLDPEPAMRWLLRHQIPAVTMGRDATADPPAFWGAGVAGLLAGFLWSLRSGSPT